MVWRTETHCHACAKRLYAKRGSYRENKGKKKEALLRRCVLGVGVLRRARVQERHYMNDTA